MSNCIIGDGVPFPTSLVKQDYSSRSEVHQFLELLSKGWVKRAQVGKYDSSEKKIPTFELDKNDFLDELLPFGTHKVYQRAQKKTKKLILTLGWILYNYKTITIETDVVSPACMYIIRGELAGLNDRHLKQLAAECLTDESFHTLLVTRAIGITEEFRKIHIEIPEFCLTRNLRLKKNSFSEPWKKMLLIFTTAVVSEIFISDYLKLLSESNTVQPFNRMTVAAHRNDEVAHSKIFKYFAKILYSSLTQEQQSFFSEILSKPIYWFADKELDLWEKILASISFPDYQSMILDCKKEHSYQLKFIDYTGICHLAAELGIENFQDKIRDVT